MVQKFRGNLTTNHLISTLAVGGNALAFLSFNNQPPLGSTDSFVLLAKDQIVLTQDITVSSGDMGVDGKKGILTTGKQNNINGNLFGNRIVLGPETTVNGNATFSNLTKTKDAEVLDEEKDTFSPPLIDFPAVADFQTGTETFRTEKGETATLSPDAFKSITTAPNTTLTLEPGAYNTETLHIGNGTTLIFQGTTTLNIKKNTTIGNNVIFSQPNDLPLDSIRINSQGTQLSIGKGSMTHGIITAPLATVTIGQQALHRGQLIGRHITVGKGMILSRKGLFTLSSPPEDLITVDDIRFYINLIDVNFTDEATFTDATRLARLLDAQIIGFGPINNLYELQIESRTVPELETAITYVGNLNDSKIEAVFRVTPFIID